MVGHVQLFQMVRLLHRLGQTLQQRQLIRLQQIMLVFGVVMVFTIWSQQVVQAQQMEISL